MTLIILISKMHQDTNSKLINAFKLDKWPFHIIVIVTLFAEIALIEWQQMFSTPAIDRSGYRALNCMGRDLGQGEEISVHLKILCVCLKHVVMFGETALPLEMLLESFYGELQLPEYVQWRWFSWKEGRRKGKGSLVEGGYG